MVMDSEILSPHDIDRLRNSVTMMKTGRLRKGETRNSNKLRTQLNNFLRACWEELPGAMRYDLYSQYRCTDYDYHAVVLRIADMVHKFLFFGKDSLSVASEEGVAELSSPISLFTRYGWFCGSYYFGFLVFMLSYLEIADIYKKNHKANDYKSVQTLRKQRLSGVNSESVVSLNRSHGNNIFISDKQECRLITPRYSSRQQQQQQQQG
jgi:hypothetical protein